MYARLASQAIDAWKTDPLFTPHFHMTGKVRRSCLLSVASLLILLGLCLLQLNGAFGSQAKLDRMRNRFEKLVSIPGKENEFEWLDNEEEIVARAPHLQGADIKVRAYSHISPVSDVLTFFLWIGVESNFQRWRRLGGRGRRHNCHR